MRACLLLTLGLFAAPVAVAQGRSDTITLEDIEKMAVRPGDAYGIVQSLKPRWLTKTEPSRESKLGGMVTPTSPHAYLDDRDMGEADFLRTIPADRVLEIRYLTANQAGSKFGPTSQPGIVVFLKK